MTRHPNFKQLISSSSRLSPNITTHMHTKRHTHPTPTNSPSLTHHHHRFCLFSVLMAATRPSSNGVREGMTTPAVPEAPLELILTNMQGHRYLVRPPTDTCWYQPTTRLLTLKQLIID